MGSRQHGGWCRAASLRPAARHASGPEAVEFPEDPGGLGAQLTVERLPVGVRELARAVVQLRVADLAVLRLLCGLEVRSAQLLLLLLPLRMSRPQRRAHEQHD